jgi:hypothetical protein
VSIQINLDDYDILKSKTKDKLRIIISENISGLELFKMNIIGKIENRS